jgi:predicted cupin superfamily sugar epimerase
MPSVNQIIDAYGLSPHPEGGYYKEVYRSGQVVVSSAAAANRSAVTHIYFLLATGQVSRFHRVAHDEIWNFYEGDPLKIVQYDGETMTETVVGPRSSSYVCVVAGGRFQAAESMGAYSLAGCTVAPGFEFSDFSFLSSEERKRMRATFPGYKKFG